ncbi:MAG: glycosyltransferase family 2 protein [Verrucomicrobia bacterium]|nr:glycosyltransferase family 2 protein [Verrucomicrobiota bacterium]
MKLDDLTPLVLTFNEAPNIRRVLERLAWAREIVVVDSFSTDGTLELVRSFPRARVVQRKFDTFAQQCNFGLEQIQTPWVLSLDADYVLSEGFSDEVAGLAPAESVCGYRAAFRYCISGRPLRASLYPPRTVLYRKSSACYHDEGHGHRVQIDGRVVMLKSMIFHDDRKPLDRWLAEQNRYMVREAAELLATPMGELKFPDRLRRRIVFAPAAVFFYTLVAKGLILDGWRGWYYVLQRTLAEMILSLRLLEAKLGGAGKPPEPRG